MCNTDSTISENIRYFIYKYELLYDDWFRDLNRIYVKLDAHVHSITNYDDVRLADAIRELCEARNSGLTQFVDENQISGICCILNKYCVYDIYCCNLFAVIVSVNIFFCSIFLSVLFLCL